MRSHYRQSRVNHHCKRALPMKKFIRGQLSAVIAIALVLVATNGSVFYFNTHQLRRNEQLVAHTHQVLAELKSTFSTIKDAEAG